RSSATPSAALSLSNRRLYVAQRIRGGLSGYSSSAGSPPSLRRSLRAPVGRTDRSGSPNARAGPPWGLQPQHRNIARHYWISWPFQSATTERLLRLPT